MIHPVKLALVESIDEAIKDLRQVGITIIRTPDQALIQRADDLQYALIKIESAITFLINEAKNETE